MELFLNLARTDIVYPETREGGNRRHDIQSADCARPNIFPDETTKDSLFTEH